MEPVAEPILQEDGAEPAPTSEEQVEMKAQISERKRLHLYKKIVKKAHISTHHCAFMHDFQASTKLPMGRVSSVLFDDIFKARSFDRYGAMIMTKLSAQAQMIADLQATLKAGRGGTNALGDDGGAGIKGTVKKQLTTPKWKIGYKPATHGPPGLAEPMQQVLNSEGNEAFFSYNGNWKGGQMTGEGTYRFSDGCTCEGSWDGNRQIGKGIAKYRDGTVYVGEWENGRYHGRGKITYPSGNRYEGMWRNGQRHGAGKLTLPSGMFYEGSFYVGKMHGRGVMKSPKTMYEYNGFWNNGYIRGTGALTLPNGKRIVKDWPPHDLQGSPLTFRGLILMVQKWRRDKFQDDFNAQERLVHVLKAIEMQEYVDEIRTEMADIKQAEKDAASEQKRAAALEMREKAKAARMAMLSPEDRADDANAGD